MHDCLNVFSSYMNSNHQEESMPGSKSDSRRRTPYTILDWCLSCEPSFMNLKWPLSVRTFLFPGWSLMVLVQNGGVLPTHWFRQAFIMWLTMPHFMHLPSFYLCCSFWNRTNSALGFSFSTSPPLNYTISSKDLFFPLSLLQHSRSFCWNSLLMIYISSNLLFYSMVMARRFL